MSIDLNDELCKNNSVTIYEIKKRIFKELVNDLPL